MRVAAWIWSSSFHRTGDVKMERGRMGSGASRVGSGWCRRERASYEPSKQYAKKQTLGVCHGARGSQKCGGEELLENTLFKYRDRWRQVHTLNDVKTGHRGRETQGS